jgi:cytochrome c oxidase cbb3-type subunit 2
MPNYPWLLENDLAYSDIASRMRALKAVGVPYSETDEEYQANVDKFGEDVARLLDINSAEANLLAQAQSGNYDGIPGRVTEMEALVAYLQVLGTMVDFSRYDEEYFVQFR